MVGPVVYTKKITTLVATPVAPTSDLSDPQATVGAPVTISLNGWFVAGTVLDGTFTPGNSTPHNAPYTVIEDSSAAVVAQNWAAFITGIDELTTQASAGRDIVIEPFAPGTIVDVATITITPPVAALAAKTTNKTTNKKKKGK
jgi:hypothetical protein